MFITFEGPDGSGKTSQIAPLAEFLRQRGYDVLATREPGGTAISDQIRAILSSLDNDSMNPRTEILLFCASRAQLVDQVIQPHLKQGGVILCDRYADSTLAYQGYGHGVDLTFLQRLLNFATGGLKPDLTFLFDLDVEVGLRRRQANGEEWNRLDAYALEFHCRVRQGYHMLAQAEPERWVTIDASRRPEQIQENLRDVAAQRLKQMV